MATLLQLVQAAQDLIKGMSRLSSVVGNTDPTARQMLAIANYGAEFLVNAHGWSALLNTRQRTLTASEVQAGFLTSIYDRFVDNSMWNIDRVEPIYGPVTPQEYAALKARNTASWVGVFQKVGADIRMWPVATPGERVTYWYYANDPVRSALGATQSEWLADTDTFLLPDRLMKLWIVKEWLKRNGLDFSAEMEDFNHALSREIASDGGRRTLDVSNSGSGRRVFAPGIQDGSWSL